VSLCSKLARPDSRKALAAPGPNKDEVNLPRGRVTASVTGRVILILLAPIFFPRNGLNDSARRSLYLDSCETSAAKVGAAWRRRLADEQCLQPVPSDPRRLASARRQSTSQNIKAATSIGGSSRRVRGFPSLWRSAPSNRNSEADELQQPLFSWSGGTRLRWCHNFSVTEKASKALRCACGGGAVQKLGLRPRHGQVDARWLEIGADATSTRSFPL